jgi:hypothetical protein
LIALNLTQGFAFGSTLGFMLPPASQAWKNTKNLSFQSIERVAMTINQQSAGQKYEKTRVHQTNDGGGFDHSRFS